MLDKQDANLVGFFKSRETSLGVLPATPTWQTREPNSFDDFGAEFTKVARRPFSPSRQRKKGNITDLDATGGYNEDLTQSNMKTELEEFFFAALRKSPEIVPDSVGAGGYLVAGAAAEGFVAGNLILASGYGSVNNGVKLVTAVDADSIDAAGLAVEATATGIVKVVGHQFGAGAITMAAAVGNEFSLLGAGLDAIDQEVIPGQWIFIGGGVDADSFEPVADTYLTGYARIAVDGVQAGEWIFDKSTFTPVTDAGAGKTLRIFFGDVVKNEDDPDLITRFSSTMERTLGRDDDGLQSEYLTGAVASEMTWNSPMANLVNLDMGYVAQKAAIRTGLQGPLSRRVSNVIAKAFSEDAFNTSSNIFRLRLAMIDPTTLNPTPAFARVTEWTLTVNNNVSSAKAQGVLGGFDTTVGNFDLDGEFTAYFSTVEAIHAVQCNYDMTFDALYAKQNAGIFVDIPLIGLGGGRLDVEMDAAIMIPVETAAAESAFGHTGMIGWFDYLPDAAMPDVDC